MTDASPRHAWQTLLSPLADALRGRQGRPLLVAAYPSAAALALTGLRQDVERDGSGSAWLLVTGSDEAATRLHDDLHFFHTLLGVPTEPLALFPEWETLPYEPIAPPADLIARRMRTLRRLVDGLPTMLVTSIPAALQQVLPKPVFDEACLRLEQGAVLDREPLVSHLLRLGYRQVSVVEIPGEFSIRGGIVDIFSTAYPDPLRVEFLGDTIESMRLFDPATQKSTGRMRRAWVLPARELIHPAGSPDSLRPLAPSAEWHAPTVYGGMHTLLDYYAGPPIVALEHPAELEKQAAEFADHVRQAYAQHGTDPDGASYPAPDGLYVPWQALSDRLRWERTLAIEAVGGAEEEAGPVVTLPVQSPASAGLGQRGTPFTETLRRLDELRAASRVLVVARSGGQVDRLLALFAEHDLPAARWSAPQWNAQTASKAPCAVVQGDLSSGFVSPDGRLALITEEELFAKGLRHRPPPKSKAATFLSSLEDVKVGDTVVHIQHGIARYQGLRRLSIQGFDSDYLILEFSGGDKLYVPLDRLNQVQRYTGPEGHQPRLDRLGGTSWARTTARVKKGIEEMAQELAELYASRELVKRDEYETDTTMSHAFEAAFEFEETQDQLRAIEDVRHDMESPKPMDRLVCGDVGYGKTEVAMRAAFKAVENNRQVAVLVPTTLLAQQHYDNFTQRFAPFPARVAMLSRFVPSRDAKAVVKDLAAGTIDVVIGTHRLLQRDIQFRNLGLVIIDEEQWFGVRHKERLKQLRTQVDVLTLTATPIPRTLQLAMSSVRDLSVIETPPMGRLAIRTQVLRFNEKVVREAILRELGRHGQVYFVHNRVQTITQTGAWLQELVPEARVALAHGQMDERLLESVMLKFLKHEADVLVTTAIIQSGLDVPNANTILINRADTFGLAQLYQLRGRVGRSGQQAYAYLFTPDEGVLSTDAQKRLVAIQEFTELGSGFRIAAADLEIRGAGNLLGKEQSGHIAAVGLDLYIKLVQDAVQSIRGRTVEEEPEDPALHLDVSAYIPDDYVADPHHRLSFYKRLTSSQQVGDLALLHSELQDRYGPAPEPVERLLEVMHIRMLAKAARLASVEVRDGAIVLTYDPKTGVPEQGVRGLMDRYERRFRMLSPRSFEVGLGRRVWAELVPELTVALQTLGFCDTK